MTAVPDGDAAQTAQAAGVEPGAVGGAAGVGVPGPAVLEAFGLSGTPVALPGGEGHSVRVADAVLKPADPDTEIAHWLAETMDSLADSDGFRISRPLRTGTGAWEHGGWTASRYAPGAEPDHRRAPRWLEIIAAGRAFHRALADFPRPGFLERRTDWWEIGNRVAWRERAADPVPGLQGPYEALNALVGDAASADPSQLVHGDLTGNVLFAAGLAPVVIDFSAYWRPPSFGEAVVVGDALLWHGAGAGLVEAAGADAGPGFVEYVARAVIFRLVTASEVMRAQAVEGSDAVAVRGEVEAARYGQVAELLAGFGG